MLRLTTLQPDYWDQLLPAEARLLSPQLRAVDDILDDERFLTPFRARFTARRGRFTIPMETYLRLMYLKRKYDLGYETLVEEVKDSLSWRRFCRLSLSARVPDASTLIKLTNGPCQGVAQEVHDALIEELAKKQVLRGRRLRVDTTVVAAEMHYPTDAGLLADGVRVVTRTIRQLAKAEAEGMGKFRDVSRSVQRRLGAIGRGLKQDGARKQATRAEMTREILAITHRMLKRARLVADRVNQEVAAQPEAAAPGVRRRLEVKLAIPGSVGAEAALRLRLHSAGFRPAYAPRQVNSAYFDSHDMTALQLSEDGLADRVKVRFRWYGSLAEPSDPSLELKFKSGNLGWKLIHPLPGRFDLSSGGWSQLVDLVIAGAPEPFGFHVGMFPRPILVNSYSRVYLESRDRTIRATIDQHIRSFDQRPYVKPNIRLETPAPQMVVVEIKAGAGQENAVPATASSLGLRITRNSKHARGLGMQ